LLVFAGPNGSGKSTATKAIPVIGLYINADDLKAQLGCSDLEAAREAERTREAALERRLDFTFETVLSTDRNLDLVRRASAAGYHVTSVFVLTADAEINVHRVANRAAMGGHSVPNDKIRSRYAKSLANLPELAHLSDQITVFDNSLAEPCVIYVRVDAKDVISPSPVWSEAAIRDLLGLANT
jgi:predicted ABC-type ATPase